MRTLRSTSSRPTLPWRQRSRNPAQAITKAAHGILTAFVDKATNARTESSQRQVRGFRNRKRLRNAIYFHLGALISTAPVSLRDTTRSTAIPEEPNRWGLMA